MNLYTHKNRKLEPPENSAIQRCEIRWNERDITALTGNVTTLSLLHTDYLLFLKQPEF